MRKPRQYQLDCIAAVRDAFASGMKGCVVELFTGAGKAFIISEVSKLTRAKGGRVLVLVNRDNLCNQLYDSLREHGLHPTMERGGDKASPMADMVCGSIQTMQGNRLKKWNPDHFRLVITDEVHFGAAKTFKATLGHFPSAFHLGLSATIKRHDGKGLWSGYQDRVFAMPLQEGINQGWLVPFEFMELPVPITIGDKLAAKKQFTQEDEDNVFNAGEYLPRLFTEAAIASEGRKTLMFWPNCDSSKAADEYFKSQGVESRHVDGYMTKTQIAEILDWFYKCEKGALHNADLLSYGYDNPSINCVGVMRIGRSIPMLLQRLGRGTRPFVRVDDYATADERKAAIAASPKPTCLILDLMLQLGEVQCKFATPTDLVTDDENEREYLRKERATSGKVSLDDLDEKLKVKRATDAEKQLAKLAEDAANAAEKHRKKYDGPYIVHILKRKAKPEWKPASDKQISYARKLGYQGDIASAWHGHQIIEAYLAHNQKESSLSH